MVENGSEYVVGDSVGEGLWRRGRRRLHRQAAATIRSVRGIVTGPIGGPVACLLLRPGPLGNSICVAESRARRPAVDASAL
jgi:hypothetical protein